RRSSIGLPSFRRLNMSDKGLRTMLVLGAIAVVMIAGRAMLPAHETKTAEAAAAGAAAREAATAEYAALVAERALKAQPLAAFLEKGLGWLAEAQHPNGGWGGGSHAAQQIRDPHAVVTDPGTTAFATMAFLRAGHTPTSGKYKETVAKALENLLGVVEAAPE